MKTKIKLPIKPKNTNAEKISISIPSALTKRVDSIASRASSSRSAVIVAAVEAYIVEMEMQVA